MPCPCQSGLSYAECCQPFHEGRAQAPTAEALMRSRYSAYALNLPAYLHRSWSAQTRPTKQSLKKGKPLEWLGLQITRTEQGGVLDDSGVVAFAARYREG
ncbi:MAG: YchJ family metal-binding protein, partial [Thiolinea sp.]